MIEDVKRLSWKELRIAKQRIAGQSIKQIAVREHPNSPEHSGVVMVSRTLNKPNVAQYLEQSKLQALKEHNITWSRIIKPISDGLKATHKIYDKEGNTIVEEQDLNTQMRASKQASELLRVKEELDPADVSKLKIPNGIDEVQLVRLLRNS